MTAPTIRQIWLALRVAAFDLDRALDDPDLSISPDVDLHVASYAVHRALVALGPFDPERCADGGE